MTEQQIQERVKNLFADLERLYKAAQPQPSSAGLAADIEECNPIPLTGNQPAEEHCPFLQSAWDRTVRYSYPSLENLCYKAGEPWAVSLAQQQKACLSGAFHDCPGFAPVKQNGKLGRVFGSLFSK